MPLSQTSTGGPAWYWAHQGQTLGPFALAQLRQLAASGRLPPTDLLQPHGGGAWVAAGSLRELFPVAAADRPAPPHGPTAGTDVAGAGEDIFDEPAAAPADERLGPMSMKGLKARPGRSLTWGDFQVIKKLGGGNMGAVYLARQKSQDREVALKVLFKHLALQPPFVERFYREAEAMARLDHPAIVPCYGVGEEKGCPYFAMEYVHGFTTARVRQELGGTFRVGDALYVVLRCAEALRHAWDRGVVHRDVKPENILLTDLGRVKLTDLGLAKPVDDDLSLTDSGTSLGTPYYMSPEQGRDAKHADHRADIYALGGVLYHLLTGRLPFEGSSMMELLRAKERGSFTPAQRLNPDVSPRLSLMLDKMLAADLSHRYQGWADVLRDLGGLGVAGEHLSFNVLQVCHAIRPPEPDPDPAERVEILLIGDNRVDILLAEEALDQSGVHSNLSVVDNGWEAVAFLRQEGKYASAARPNLIVLGLDLARQDGLAVLGAFKAGDFRDIPLIVLGSSPDTTAVLQANGLPVSLRVTRPEDAQLFEGIVKSVYELCVTVVERDRGP